ncbi:MAG: hypothetical protein JW786_11970 [Desulfobacterales bacterium]|nr:hypothetical protein [Desulfobacterales bacterium]
MGRNKLDERTRMMGQLVIDFVNAENSDEAGLTYLANLQKIFDFPEDFVEEAQGNFPRIYNYKSVLNEEETDALKCIVQKDLVANIVLDEYFVLGVTGVETEEVFSNTTGESLYTQIVPITKQEASHFIKRFIVENWGDSLSITANLQDIHDKIEPLLRKERRGDGVQEVKSLLADFQYLDAKLIQHKKRINPEKFSTIEKFANIFSQNYIEHKEMLSISTTLREVIIDIINNKKIVPSSFLNFFLVFYNLISWGKVYLAEDGLLVEELPFTESNFQRDKIEQTPLYLKEYYCQPISYCLINFLKNRDNLKLLHKCQNCGKFYISKTLRESIFCHGDKCRLAFHNRRRIESGENREYKRKKRESKESKLSYFGYKNNDG